MKSLLGIVMVAVVGLIWVSQLHAKTIYSSDLGWKDVLLHSIGGGKALSNEAADAIDRSVTGNILDKSAPSVEPGDTKVPFACGPQTLD